MRVGWFFLACFFFALRPVWAVEAGKAEQRRAIEMACFSELTHVEIAAALGVPLGTIKTRIRTGMEKLRGSLMQPQYSSGESA